MVGWRGEVVDSRRVQVWGGEWMGFPVRVPCRAL